MVDVRSYRMANGPIAFFAYPAEPPELRSTIQKAQQISSTKRVRVAAGPQRDVFGAHIPDEVRNGIDDSEFAFFDVTIPNQNVYYELGYAIGLGKRVGPVLNTSFEGAARRIQHQGKIG